MGSHSEYHFITSIKSQIYSSFVTLIKNRNETSVGSSISGINFFTVSGEVPLNLDERGALAEKSRHLTDTRGRRRTTLKLDFCFLEFFSLSCFLFLLTFFIFHFCFFCLRLRRLPSLRHSHRRRNFKTDSSLGH